MPQDPIQFDLESRTKQLTDHFQETGRDKARGEIALLPYYNQLENEITKPNQGTFVTRYFQTKWRPCLGSEASSIVLALRLLANKDGETFASQETIASCAGLSARALRRWLSDNEDAVAACSPRWQAQWQLLHRHFLRSKSSRYLIRREGTYSRARRTTNLYHVAMDDPVHPDDEPTLLANAAVRIASEEHATSLQQEGVSHGGQSGRKRKNVILRETGSRDGGVDNSARSGHSGRHEARPDWPSRSVTYRSELSASSAISKKTTNGLRTHPVVRQLSSAELQHRERQAAMHEDRLKQLARDDSAERHESAGFIRRVNLLAPGLAETALARTIDTFSTRNEDGGQRIRKNVGSYYIGTLRHLAAEQQIDLGVRWSQKTPESPEPGVDPVRRVNTQAS